MNLSHRLRTMTVLAAGLALIGGFLAVTTTTAQAASDDQGTVTVGPIPPWGTTDGQVSVSGSKDPDPSSGSSVTGEKKPEVGSESGGSVTGEKTPDPGSADGSVTGERKPEVGSESGGSVTGEKTPDPGSADGSVEKAPDCAPARENQTKPYNPECDDDTWNIELVPGDSGGPWYVPRQDPNPAAPAPAETEPGVTGQVTVSYGSLPSGLSIAYEARNCDGVTGVVDEEMGFAWVQSDGSFTVGARTHDCYYMAVITADGTASLRTTYNGVSGFFHTIPTGSRGVVLTIQVDPPGASGVGGTLTVLSGQAIEGLWLQYDDVTCDGQNNTGAADDDDASVFISADGSFLGGAKSDGCYQIAVYDRMAAVRVQSTYKGTTAFSHIVPAGSRNIALTIESFTGEPARGARACSGGLVIDGVAQVGRELLATGLDCPNSELIEYTWRRCSYRAGTACPVIGTGQTYTPTEADAGVILSVYVETRTNGLLESYYADTDTIQPAALSFADILREVLLVLKAALARLLAIFG
jgi:hypothetical protein